MFERPTPPTARIASVRGIRRVGERHILEGLDGDTLVEVHIVGCMISDEAIMAQISVTATGVAATYHTMAMVPIRWYEELPRMRELLEVPSDARMMSESVCPQQLGMTRPRRRRPNVQELIRLDHESGRGIAESWRRASASHLRLSEKTRDWLGICEEDIPEDMAVEYLRIRKTLAHIMIRRSDRRAVALFCEQLSERLSKAQP